MNAARTVVSASIRLAGGLSPRWGAAIAMPAFSAVARPRAVSCDDQPTMWRARRRTVRIAGLDGRGTDVAVYEWGAGPRTVVLMHGWDGRASQFATLARELVAEGFRVVAFDAPAHGISTGRRTYLMDWIDVLRQLQERHGTLAGVVGHSFGGLAALVGVAGGVHADSVVTIAAPADAEALLTQFRAMLRYSDRVSDAMAVRFATRYFPADPDPFAWLSAVRRPLPAGTPLLVIHDEKDRMMPVAEAQRIRAAHPGAATLITRGLGHNRILTADALLDAVPAFVLDATRRAQAPAADSPAERAGRERERVTLEAVPA